MTDTITGSRLQHVVPPPLPGLNLPAVPLVVPALEVPAPAILPVRQEDVIFKEAPARWQGSPDLDALLKWGRAQGINDITITSERNVLGKRHGRYRPVTLTPVVGDDVERLTRAVKNGAVISKGDTYRGSYNVMLDLEERLLLRSRVTITHTTGMSDGHSITFRLIPDNIPTAADVQLPQELVDAFSYKYGLGLICGKMESGKTYTCAAILDGWTVRPDCSRKHLHFGNPIEFLFDRHPGRDFVVQKEIPAAVASYALALKAAKSETPDAIIIEEINDVETMSMTIDTASSGVAVLGTLHISAVAEFPNTMMTYYPDADEREARLHAAMQNLKVILVQRLEPAVRDNDPNQPDGRVCLREYLVLDEDMRFKVMSHPTKDWSQVLHRLVAAHGCRMVDSARQYFEAGRLTSDVYERIEKGRAI